MSLNVASPDTKEITLATWGGLVTNQDPVTLPMGVSPDLSECSFLLGGVNQRPCFRKVLAAPFGACTVTYAKSYVDEANVIRNLYLDSLGNLWMENITTGAAPVIISTTTPGSYAKSVTAFGREFIAISDGLHGQDIPLQYDGTNLDRVTQDGPGAPPAVVALSLPSVQIAATGAIVITPVEADPQNLSNGVYTSINVFTASSIAGVVEGGSLTLSGFTGASAPLNGTWPVLQVFTSPPYSTNLIILGANLPDTTVSQVGGTATVPTGALIRQNNIVTANTATPHQLQIGYQAQIAGEPATEIGGGIASIVINNADNPGVATVNTNTPHGLVPDNEVGITGVGPQRIAGVTGVFINGGILTITTDQPHNLVPGAVVTISDTNVASANTTVSVVQVTGPSSFTAFLTAADSPAGGPQPPAAQVVLNWPVPDTVTAQYFQVLSAPTPTSFQIPLSYCNGTWTGSGQVSFAWDGTFYVTAIPTPTSFQYQQYGPNASTGSTNGTVTPYGQAAPGIHQLQVLFLTRKGYTTKPSPPVQFIANGGQYISVSNIPIGPPNVVARILAFTGAGGAYFFYIPTVPQVNGQIVGTATQINDNTTTAAVLDFGDNTLYAALGISIPGNNLANQVIIDSALGFGFYGSRLMTYGQRNTVHNFLNLGFDGGYQPNSPMLPSGWTDDGSGGGTLATGHYGQGWKIAIAPATPKGAISQSAYEDYSGAPIIQPNTLYYVRLWMQIDTPAADVNFNVILTSTSAHWSVTASVNGANISATGGWVEATFSGPTISEIPEDLLLQILAVSSATTTNLVVDEISMVYADSRYLTGLYGSYVNNPEAFDGVTGVFGPENDTHQVMDISIIRNLFYMLTQDPSGRLHQTSQGTTEPAQWVVNEVAANCGALSAFSLTRSQADDDSAAGGEEWFAWFSSTGIRIFGGNDPDKISQEIQRPSGYNFPGTPVDLGALNTAAQLTVWGLNDPKEKVMYFGIPALFATAPSTIWMVSYLGMDSAAAIAAGAPVHRSLSGRMTANDLSRKWSPWVRPMNGAALMYRSTSEIVSVFFGGNGQTPGPSGTGQVYILDPTLKTDDDYGQVQPYYTTYAFPDRDQEQALQLGGHMKMVAYTGTQIPEGTGKVRIQVLPNVLAGPNSPWPLDANYEMLAAAGFDFEWSGGNCQAQRFFFRFTFSPKTGTDVAFSLASFTIAVKQARHIPVRGALPG